MPILSPTGGLFWADKERKVRGAPAEAKPKVERVAKERVITTRSLPPIPETGWTPPTEFPDLSNADVIGLDTETYDPDLKSKGPGTRRDGYIIGVSVATSQGFKRYYPVRHQMGGNLDAEQVFGWLREQLSRPRQVKVGANILYDLDYLANEGVTVAGPVEDIQVAEPLLDENARSFSLDSLARKYLTMTKFEGELKRWGEIAFGKDQYKNNLWRTPVELVGPYAEVDADLPIRIREKQVQVLKAEGLEDLYRLECKLIPILLGMRRRGVRIDVEGAERLLGRLDGDISGLSKRMRDLTGMDVNVNAADSLAQAFTAAGVPFPRSETTGKPTFQKAWLKHHKHPLPGLVTKLRGVMKFKATFVQGYVLDSHINGRIHCQFHQLRGDENGTVSGRFSSSDPNLQNIPIRDDEVGPLIRALFLPDEGQLWYAKDWSQIEYRLIVHYAALRGFPGADDAVQRYNQDRATDFHQVVADLTGLPRKDAKNVNFGIAYGQGKDLLASNLGLSLDEAEAFLHTYHARAPFIRKLADQVKAKVEASGFVRTLLGRRRRFTQDDKGRYEFTHKSLNALIQGSAADIMKKAMVQAGDDGVYDVVGWPLLTVHDELGMSGDAHNSHHVEALDHLHHIMENCVRLLVPLLAEGSSGDNWAKAK
jgi:DNA polymerase I-like protein with 3'-5' exonuclease and polymerase domains